MNILETNKSYYPNSLTQEYSPSIPKAFPRERIPKELCQAEFLKLSLCVLVRGDGNTCPVEYGEFLSCKKERDLKVYANIKEWETDLFNKMNSKEKEIYKYELDQKLAQFKENMQKIPDSASFANKKWRFESDIEQLKWRLAYLK